MLARKNKKSFTKTIKYKQIKVLKKKFLYYFNKKTFSEKSFVLGFHMFYVFTNFIVN